MTYKLFLIEPDRYYFGAAIVSAEDSQEANRIIQKFKDEDPDNEVDSRGYTFVSDNDMIDGAIGTEKGILHYGIRYSG